MTRGVPAFVLLLLLAGACHKPTPQLGPAEFYWLMNRACYSGDDIGVTMLLKAGADPDGKRDYAAFHQSSYQGGFEPSWPINQAAYGGHVKVAQLLLRAGAKPDAPEHRGETALSIAAERGDLEFVKVLLAAGADRTARRPGERGFDGNADELARHSGHSAVADAIRDFRSK